MAFGRPTPYKEDFGEKAYDILSKGLSMAGVAKELGVTRKTVYNWMEKYPEFLYSIERGVEAGQDFYERIMRAKITGQKNSNFDPKNSCTSSLQFTLKTRFHKDYGNKDKLDIAQTSEIKISIDAEDEAL